MGTVIDSRTPSTETTEGSNEVERFLSTVLPRQIEADDAMHKGIVEPRFALWSHHDPVTLFGALGLDVRGWEEASRAFHSLTSVFSDFTPITFELVAADVSGDLAYTVGYERSTGSVNGRPVRTIMLRVTHVYRRENGEWKIVHRHAYYPPAEQSSPAVKTATDAAAS